MTTTGIDAEALEMLNTKAEPEINEVTLSAEELLKLRAPMTEEEMLQPGIVEALVAEIKAAAGRAVHYKNEMETATTSTKRDHYKKKLSRNNDEAADIILALERIIKVKEAHEANDDATGDTVQTSPREESSN